MHEYYIFDRHSDKTTSNIEERVCVKDRERKHQSCRAIYLYTFYIDNIHHFCIINNNSQTLCVICSSCQILYFYHSFKRIWFSFVSREICCVQAKSLDRLHLFYWQKGVVSSALAQMQLNMIRLFRILFILVWAIKESIFTFQLTFLCNSSQTPQKNIYQILNVYLTSLGLTFDGSSIRCSHWSYFVLCLIDVHWLIAITLLI